MFIMRPISWLLAVFWLTTSPLAIADPSGSFSIYLTRHAEKTSLQDNPGLTTCGQQRALYLGQWLARQQPQIEAIYSTDYRRTLDTAAASAEILQLSVQHYDPRQLPQFAERLLAAKQTALVVGHSNTTPQLAFLLSDQQASPIDHDEFGRIYRLDVGKERVVLTEVAMAFTCN
ncbi:histidine phosphatase family protein [Neiella sp. HB171785]|uniref:Histidine phosphatase family protein n=1 Tax=Neiella litorisoli TaxID=2771431 RepID=A0A8J6UPQ8_9GAMM|nr:phosphoglycerate mutase family protein [Neiella litorisoli]MBD1389192.1 histidine phosphatase family protein [Neiella litorisoli]